jgi:hypothetical protein
MFHRYNDASSQFTAGAILTPDVHLQLRISPQIFAKIQNGSLRGTGEDDL